MKHPNRHRQQ